MSFLDSVTIPSIPTRFPRKRTGGFLNKITLPQDQVRATKVFGIRQEAVTARQQAEELSGFIGIAEETAKDIFRRTIQVGRGFFRDVFEAQRQFIPKTIKNIEEAAEDIREGKILKGVAKAGLRTAGDAAITIFAPISAAIGAALQLTKGQTLIDKAGEVIADKSGITDMKAFQKFAIEHPNAGEDFDRLLFLGLVSIGGRARIDPKRIATDIKAFADKIVASEVQPTLVIPQVKGGFLERVVQPEVPAEPTIVPTEVVARPRAKVPEKISKVAITIEERAIEQKLTEGFEGKAGFDPITIKEQARIVSDLIRTDIEKAKRMVRGDEPVPDNLRGSSLIVGLEEHALRRGDVTLLRDLSKSPLTAETSRFAQELRVLAERAPESPVRIMQDITKARETALEKRTKKKASQIKKSTVNEIKSEIKKGVSKRPTWEEFVREIQCK